MVALRWARVVVGAFRFARVVVGAFFGASFAPSILAGVARAPTVALPAPGKAVHPHTTINAVAVSSRAIRQASR